MNNKQRPPWRILLESLQAHNAALAVFLYDDVNAVQQNKLVQARSKIAEACELIRSCYEERN